MTMNWELERNILRICYFGRWYLTQEFTFDGIMPRSWYFTWKKSLWLGHIVNIWLGIIQKYLHWVPKKSSQIFRKYLRKYSLREKYPYSEFFWSIFSPNTGKYEPEKLQIRKIFTQSLTHEYDGLLKNLRI